MVIIERSRKPASFEKIEVMRMPWMEILGTGIVAAATFAFNPIPQFIQNPLFAAAITVGIGIGIVYFLGDKHAIVKIAGAGIAIAGIIGLVNQFIGQLGGGK
jgi:drug/metabolite transporter (DMT)-like permease